MTSYSTVRVLIIFVCFINQTKGQLVDVPLLAHEKLNFFSHISEVRGLFSQLSELRITSGLEKSFIHNIDSYTILKKIDSSYNKVEVVNLFFTKQDSLLKLVQYLIIPHFRHSDESETYLKKFWSDTIIRFGKDGVEQTLPLLGKMVVWERKRIKIQLIHITTGSKIITLSYAPIK